MRLHYKNSLNRPASAWPVVKRSDQSHYLDQVDCAPGWRIGFFCLVRSFWPCKIFLVFLILAFHLHFTCDTTAPPKQARDLKLLCMRALWTYCEVLQQFFIRFDHPNPSNLFVVLRQRFLGLSCHNQASISTNSCHGTEKVACMCHLGHRDAAQTIFRSVRSIVLELDMGQKKGAKNKMFESCTFLHNSTKTV